MTQQTGRVAAALQAGQAALARQRGVAAEADRALADVLAAAHATVVEATGRLDEIAAEIDHAVRNQAALAVNTPIGAREFRRFLIAKQREIIAVVSHAHQVDMQAQTVLKALRSQYATPMGS
ncbi:DUF4226 domain-containing protein [Mycobacterium sp. SM1]|uniref:DUF4226 domain-containing protein n=1 Tax=Mycobacterium sp. SM1 TaxID=2816243 RepID=UPI001BD11271|nr:DUF4226 domain-containing protein [Mycobacterium sp. SM1]MBS4728088.1 DUF4226 domain-containing protein [Mycobacterium sp. SM1]